MLVAESAVADVVEYEVSVAESEDVASDGYVVEVDVGVCDP